MSRAAVQHLPETSRRVFQGCRSRGSPRDRLEAVSQARTNDLDLSTGPLNIARPTARQSGFPSLRAHPPRPQIFPDPPRAFLPRRPTTRVTSELTAPKSWIQQRPPNEVARLPSPRAEGPTPFEIKRPFHGANGDKCRGQMARLELAPRFASFPPA